MYFIGSGALLSRVVNYSLTAGLKIDGICCPPGDSAIPGLRNRAMAVLESTDPNTDFAPLLAQVADGIIFSINNRCIIADALLRSRAKFFNIHNGLIQRYRGIAEVCIFAALCRGDDRYGVTLQQLLPNQRVDCGPVVAQIEFPIGPKDSFADVLQRSLAACQRIFEANVGRILRDSYPSAMLEPAQAALAYKDVASLSGAADHNRLARAADLGRYTGFFPELKAVIESVRV
jgi:methionyl-tRNA formyltransferase